MTTRICSPGVQGLADAAAGLVLPGLTLLTAEFTPTASGFTLFGFSWDGRTSVADLANFELFVLTGGPISTGGVVVDGVRYRQGPSPDILVTGGDPPAIVPAFGSTPVPGPGQGAPSQTMSAARQLAVGTAYLLQLKISGTNPAAAYAGQLVNFYACEQP